MPARRRRARPTRIHRPDRQRDRRRCPGHERLHDRVHSRNRPQIRVDIEVASGVEEVDVPAQGPASTEPHDRAVVDRDHRRTRLGEDGRGGGGRVRVDCDRRVGGPHGLTVQPGRRGIEIACRSGHREAAFDQLAKRVDHPFWDPADHLGAQQHRLHVPPGVVIGVDRVLKVRGGAGRVQVAGSGEDRVDRVVRVGVAGVGGVDAVALPGRGQELHPADGTCAGDRQVPPVVGLDLIDRRQHRPRNVVLDPRRLVDGEQERRDLKARDEEVGDRRRRRGKRERERRGGRGRCRPHGVARRSRCGRQRLPPRPGRVAPPFGGAHRAVRPRGMAPAAPPAAGMPPRVRPTLRVRASRATAPGGCNRGRHGRRRHGGGRCRVGGGAGRGRIGRGGDSGGRCARCGGATLGAPAGSRDRRGRRLAGDRSRAQHEHRAPRQRRRPGQSKRSSKCAVCHWTSPCSAGRAPRRRDAALGARRHAGACGEQSSDRAIARGPLPQPDRVARRRPRRRAASRHPLVAPPTSFSQSSCWDRPSRLIVAPQSRSTSHVCPLGQPLDLNVLPVSGRVPGYPRAGGVWPRRIRQGQMIYFLAHG